MFGIGMPEITVILLVILLFAGGKKLPEFSKGLGEAIRELRKGFLDDVKADNSSEKKTAKKSSSKNAA